ncbi:unnamed protein product, partial [marine sediment metagenome]
GVLVTVPFTYSQAQPFQTVWMKKLDEYGIKRQPYVHGAFTAKHLKTLVAKAGFQTIKSGLVGKSSIHLYAKLRKAK